MLLVTEKKVFFHDKIVLFTPEKLLQEKIL